MFANIEIGYGPRLVKNVAQFRRLVQKYGAFCQVDRSNKEHIFLICLDYVCAFLLGSASFLQLHCGCGFDPNKRILNGSPGRLDAARSYRRLYRALGTHHGHCS